MQIVHGQLADIPARPRVALSVDRLRALKFSGSKAEYLLGAARAVAEERLHRLFVWSKLTGGWEQLTCELE